MVAMKLLPAVWLLSIYRMQEQDGKKKKKKSTTKKPTTKQKNTNKTQPPSSPLSSHESDNLQQPDYKGSGRNMKR